MQPISGVRSFRRWFAGLGILCALGALPPRPAHAQGEPAPLTTIKAIRALTPEAANQQRRVLIRGTVTYINERDPASIIVHDGKAGQFVRYGSKYLRTNSRIDLHPGDVIEVDGYTTGGGFAPDVFPDGVRRVGKSALPSPKRVPYAALLSGVFDCDYIEAVGVGQRAWVSESGKTMFLDVAVEGGTVRAWFWDFTPIDLTRFIDARVRLLGSAGILYNTGRQVRGVSLFGARTADAVIETPAPDPSSLPVRAIWSLYTHQTMDQLDRRVRLRGTVTGTRVGQPVLVEDITMHVKSRDVRHSIYVRDETSAALVHTDQPFELTPGDIVDVVGFPVVSSTNRSTRTGRSSTRVPGRGAQDSAWPRASRIRARFKGRSGSRSESASSCRSSATIVSSCWLETGSISSDRCRGVVLLEWRL
jgi:hypothetical protein